LHIVIIGPLQRHAPRASEKNLHPIALRVLKLKH
jgi:hypothetical protein